MMNARVAAITNSFLVKYSFGLWGDGVMHDNQGSALQN
jgi:hypothetical protein